MQKIFSLLLLFPLALAAQTADNPRNEQRISDEDIYSVQLHLSGAPLTLPMVDLRAGNGAMLFEFDRLGTDVHDYLYSLEHCNADWQRSELNDNEYIDGFTEDRLTTYYSSFNTLQQYVHYYVALPNANMRWTKSGNYLLKIYDNTDEKQLVIVRRFVVVEPGWSAAINFVTPTMVSKMNTCHEIDFTVNTKGANISYPQKEIKAYVLQNGRWETAIGPLPPQVMRQNQMVFDYQDKIVFPAGKEWRYFDLRSFYSRGEYVKDIRNRRDYYEVTLKPEETRAGRSYIYHGDLNGRFSIENINPNETLENCDYAQVLFSILRNAPFEDEDVYVFGELSDWQLKPEFRMRYEESVHAYVCEVFLKQGYYNYEYLVADRKTGQVDEEGLEGNWHETGNQYSVLVYYRPFGERYDHLMLTATMDSRLK